MGGRVRSLTSAGKQIPKQKNEGGDDPSKISSLTQIHQLCVFLSPGKNVGKDRGEEY